jgi:hypothetical protein
VSLEEANCFPEGKGSNGTIKNQNWYKDAFGKHQYPLINQRK